MINVIKTYFVDHVGEELKPDSIKWDLTGQLPVIKISQEKVEDTK